MSSASSLKKPPRDYCAIARQYAKDILSGKIPACLFVRQACKRQTDDLAKTDWEYEFDPEKASKVCRFCELCPHIEGRQFVGKRLKLEPWQVWHLTTIFGWVRKENGIRRFKRVYIEVPKGNGKSFEVSAIANYLAFADQEPGSQVYSAATSREQARFTFGISQKMLREMSNFCAKAGIEVEAHRILQRKSNSVFRPLSSDAKGVEGTNPYAIFIDEMHLSADRKLLDNAETACGKRQGSLLWAITTSGSDRSGICYEWHQYLQKILSVVIADETFFGIIYSLDDDDDWTQPENWRKANPNWGVSVLIDEIGAKAQKAMQMATAQAAFKTKHLDLWVGAQSAWMDMVRFLKCGDRELSEDDFLGQPCVIGLDLASKLDLLAAVKVFWREFEDKRHYYAFSTYWAPEVQIEESNNSQYQGWEIDGWLRSCPGETNDYSMVEDWVRETAARFNLLEVSHDPWQAHELATNLAADGLHVVEVPQMPKHLSQPMKDLEGWVHSGQFHYDGNPITTWCASNVVNKEDRNGNYFPNKERKENKIDGITALLTAINGVTRYAGAEGGAGGVTVFGDCEKCGALCIGVLVGDRVMFRCDQHQEKPS